MTPSIDRRRFLSAGASVGAAVGIVGLGGPGRAAAADLTQDLSFNVFGAQGITLVVSAEISLFLRIEAWPSRFVNAVPDELPPVPIPSPAGPYWEVEGTRTITIPPLGRAYDYANGFGVIRVRSVNGLGQTIAVPFVAYLSIDGSGALQPVSGDGFSGDTFRIPVPGAGEKIRLCFTSVTGGNLQIRSMWNGGQPLLGAGLGMPPLHSFLFDHQSLFPDLLRVQLSGGSGRCSATIQPAKGPPARLYPAAS